jgi:uncharacterized protein YyaL (SSP411 family)
MSEANQSHMQRSASPHGQHKHTNRLINETSPYLLQHAHNPVDWYSWGDEALAKAKAEDKPMLLSIGYSACHWCHVMERESFENEQIAKIMNRHFVSIKVDREERPDLDSIYMQALQALTQQGGWPMTMFLTPEGKPFYGGTYFPPQDRMYGRGTRMPGFASVLRNVIRAYREQRDEIEEQASQLALYLHEQSIAPLRRGSHALATSQRPDLALLARALPKIEATFDRVYGGFGGAPKFPHTAVLEFLLRLHVHYIHAELSAPQEHGKPSALAMVEFTLQRMAHGGIYDQLGGGFHRYSVDERWLVPHFEKMLYDNALLSRVYLHTYLVTGNAFYRRIAEETLDYVVREMTSPEGGFYSTQDADSEGEEGKFFLWTRQELDQILPGRDAELFAVYYNVTPAGNFEGKNILNIPHSASEVAQFVGVDLKQLQSSLAVSRKRLFTVREGRVKSGRDEKILTSWNGLMLRSFAEAARHLHRSDYLQVAIRNAEFLLDHLQRDGRLLRTYKDGQVRLNGYLEDYVVLADGLLALYESSFDPRWFSEARRLVDLVLQLFVDKQNSGFFDTSSDHEALINRPKDIMDNALPAGNNVACDVLLRLAAFTGEAAYRQVADEYLQALAEIIVQYPQTFGHVLGALDFALSATKEIAIVGDPRQADTRSLLNSVNARYLPNSVIACKSERTQGKIIPLLADRIARDGHATGYVCQNFTCQSPVTTKDALEKLLH